MLVDPKFINFYGPTAEQYVPKPIKPGLYSANYFLRDMCEVELIEYADKHLWDLPADERMRKYMEFISSPDYIPDYGMCDDDEQLFRRFPQIVTSPNKYLVTFNLIDKKDEPDCGGFRPHKHGEYYGEQDFQGYEYFAHEPNMDHVCVFHVYGVTDKPNTRIPPREKWPEIQARLAAEFEKR